MYRSRNYFLIGLIALHVIAATLLALSRTDYRVDLSSVVEIWGDVVRDADKFGRTLTTVSIEKEIEIGNEIAKSFHPITDEHLQGYIDEVGKALTAHVRRRGIPYRFQVINWPVVNAFAVAGGHIYITTGMLNSIESEAELAGILAHEVAHVDLKHTIQKLQYELLLRRIVGEDLASIVRIGQYLLTVSYSEQQEREADRTGMIIMAQAGYSPIEVIRAFVGVGSELAPLPEQPVKPKRPELEIGRAIKDALGDYFATHPVWQERVQDLDTILQRNMAAWQGKTFYIGRSNYSDRVPRSSDQRDDETIVYSADLPELRAVRGELLIRIGNYYQAIKHLDQAIASGPRMSKAYRLRASAYASLGEYEKSLSDLNAVFDIWRSDLDGLRARLETVSDDPEQALRIEILSKMIALLGDQLSLKRNAADIIENLAQPERAAATKDDVAQLNLELVNLTNERGFLRLDQGHYEDALSDFEDALSFSPVSKEAAGGKAIALLSSIIEKNPQDAEAYLKRGNHYRDLAMLDLATADYSQAIAVEPKMAKAYAKRGFLLFDQGRFQAALADFEDALSLFPEPQDAIDGTSLASLTVEILLERSERGEPEAQYALANAYSKGEAVERDQTLALHWWRKAAESGHPGAQEKLANAYRTGEGVLLDFKESAHWARKAVESNLASTREAISQTSGDPDAMLQLANANRFGKGTSKNMSKALTWYRRAAAAGNAEAAFILGVLYERGEEVEQNLVMAHMWFSIAEPNSSHARIRKKFVVRKMSRAQVAEAERLAHEWQARSRSSSTPVRHTVEPGATDYRVCYMAINQSDDDWEKHPSFGNWIDEARNRGLELNDCVKLVKANEVIRARIEPERGRTGSPFGRATDKRVCDMATGNNQWQRRRSLQKWVDEARERGLSLEDCEKVLHDVEPGASDARVCDMAIRHSDGEWEKDPEFGIWVDEARNRGLKLKDCEKLLRAN